MTTSSGEQAVQRTAATDRSDPIAGVLRPVIRRLTAGEQATADRVRRDRGRPGGRDI
jgi:hypothetical protein